MTFTNVSTIENFLLRKNGIFNNDTVTKRTNLIKIYSTLTKHVHSISSVMEKNA